jgi:hypothetical protein
MGKSEAYVETYLVKQTKRLGGKAIKLTCPGAAGIPDRLILLPGGRLCFCETKAPDEKARPLQLYWHEQLRRLGFTVYVCDNRLKVDMMLSAEGGDFDEVHST